jgi:hypothetical protein
MDAPQIASRKKVLFVCAQNKIRSDWTRSRMIPLRGLNHLLQFESAIPGRGHIGDPNPFPSLTFEKNAALACAIAALEKRSL